MCLSSFQEGKEWAEHFERPGPPAHRSGRESCQRKSREAGVDVPEKGANYSWGPKRVWWKERWAGEKEVGV